jgi:hypothetical protein
MASTLLQRQFQPEMNPQVQKASFSIEIVSPFGESEKSHEKGEAG